jgi:CheY-like chemotaxis protein
MAKTVLIIDDDQDDLDIMKQAIQSIDPDLFCLSFIYPEEALKIILGNEFVVTPDYIFIDINMPGITGDKCLKAIRASRNHDNIIITLYSTSMPDTVAEALISTGANHVFEKPVKMKKYTEILSEILIDR